MSIKRFLLVTAAAVLLAAPVLWSAGLQSTPADAAPPAQEQTPQDRTITVTGYGVAYGSPDIARVGLGVETTSTDIQAALQEANTRLDAVLAALEESGVASEDMQTNYFSIYQNYYGGPDSPEPPSYRVSSSLNVRVRDTDQVGDLIATAIDSGANVVNFVEFSIADQGALQSDARQRAIQDARARAEEIAAALALTVGEAVRVVEEPVVGFQAYGLGGGGGAASAGAPPIEEGSLSVSMSITITYAVE